MATSLSDPTASSFHRGPLGETLASLRVGGSMLLRETYSPPFGVAVPPTKELAQALGSPPDVRVTALHFAEAGSFELRRPGKQPLLVEPGEIVLCFGGGAHELGLGAKCRNVPFAQLLRDQVRATSGPAVQGVQPHGAGPYGPRQRSDSGHVRIICGALALHNTQLNPLFASLPDIVHLRTGVSTETLRLREITALLSAELERKDPATHFVVERLLEVLCALAIRSQAMASQQETGWFQGLADQSLNLTLTAFHADPGRPWDVPMLARIASLSPSRFSARFREVMGVSAMIYVTKWRMHLAMRALAQSDRGIADISMTLGYESVPAFSRAFKKHVGSPPAAYRNGRA